MCQKALALLEHFPSLESHIFFADHTLLHPRNSYELLPAKQEKRFKEAAFFHVYTRHYCPLRS